MVALASKDKRVKAMVIVATPHGSLSGGLNSRFGEGMRTNFDEDLKKYDLVRDIGKIQCPILIIHGKLDEVVPVNHAYQLYEKANEPKRLEIIQDGDHAIRSPEHLNHIMNLSLGWFQK